MSSFFASVLAATWLVAVPGFCAWLGTWKPAHARRLLARGALLLDVAPPEQYAQEHLDGAVNVPASELALRQLELGDHGRPIVLYARSRLRSAVASQTLRGIGFHDVFNVGTLRSAAVADLRAGSPP